MLRNSPITKYQPAIDSLTRGPARETGKKGKREESILTGETERVRDSSDTVRRNCCRDFHAVSVHLIREVVDGFLDDRAVWYCLFLIGISFHAIMLREAIVFGNCYCH